MQNMATLSKKRWRQSHIVIDKDSKTDSDCDNHDSMILITSYLRWELLEKIRYTSDHLTFLYEACQLPIKYYLKDP
jgi:hypothetical protein